jgi:hypothetical protein
MSYTVIANGWSHESTVRLIKLAVSQLYATDGPLKVPSTDPMVRETRDLAQRLEAGILDNLVELNLDEDPSEDRR